MSEVVEQTVDAKTKYLVIKVSNRNGSLMGMSLEDIVQRACGEWHITYNRVAKVRRAIVMSQGRILAECTVGDMFLVNRDTGRMTFELTMIKDSQLKNVQMNAYKAPNPISVKTAGQIDELIAASDKPKA